MSIFTCPFCGPRELHEFHFHKTVAAPGASPFAQVYQRANHVGESIEHWQHIHGCRAWLLVRRNPSSAQVFGVRLLGGTPRHD